MAPSPKYFPFLFLLFLISSLQIHARESQFFSKATRDNNSSNNNNNNAATKETEIPESEGPSSAQDEEPSFTPQNHNGFGLYGHGSKQFSPKSVNDAFYTPNNFPEKANTQQYTHEKSEQETFNTGYPTNNNNYNGYKTKQQGMSDNMDTAYLNNNNNNYYNFGSRSASDSVDSVDTAYLNNNNNKNYKYGTKQQSMSDNMEKAYLNNNNYYKYGSRSTTDSVDSVDTAYLNKNNKYGTKQQSMSESRDVDKAYLNNNNYYYNGNENKQQGMSDTRFLENGKYYYGSNNENSYNDRYHNQYETQKESQNRFGSYKGVGSRNGYKYGGYNGNTKNTYEYTNSMDEFQNQDDQEFHESQEEFVP